MHCDRAEVGGRGTRARRLIRVPQRLQAHRQGLHRHIRRYVDRRGEPRRNDLRARVPLEDSTSRRFSSSALPTCEACMCRACTRACRLHPQNHNAEAIAWQFVVTREGATPVTRPRWTRPSSADRMAPDWTWTGTTWQRAGRLAVRRSGGGGRHSPDVSFVSVCWELAGDGGSASSRSRPRRRRTAAKATAEQVQERGDPTKSVCSETRRSAYSRSEEPERPRSRRDRHDRRHDLRPQLLRRGSVRSPRSARSRAARRARTRRARRARLATALHGESKTTAAASRRSRPPRASAASPSARPAARERAERATDAEAGEQEAEYVRARCTGTTRSRRARR